MAKGRINFPNRRATNTYALLLKTQNENNNWGKVELNSYNQGKGSRL